MKPSSNPFAILRARVAIVTTLVMGMQAAPSSQDPSADERELAPPRFKHAQRWLGRPLVADQIDSPFLGSMQPGSEGKAASSFERAIAPAARRLEVNRSRQVITQGLRNTGKHGTVELAQFLSGTDDLRMGDYVAIKNIESMREADIACDLADTKGGEGDKNRLCVSYGFAEATGMDRRRPLATGPVLVMEPLPAGSLAEALGFKNGVHFDLLPEHKMRVDAPESYTEVFTLFQKSPMAYKVSILKQMMQAVRYMHKKEYVHMDLHAANFVFGPGGIIKLTDFGLTKHFHEANSPDTAWRFALGPATSGYFLLLGNAQDLKDNQGARLFGSGIDARQERAKAADMFALGVLAHVILFGRESLANMANRATSYDVRMKSPPYMYQGHRLNWPQYSAIRLFNGETDWLYENDSNGNDWFPLKTAAIDDKEMMIKLVHGLLGRALPNAPGWKKLMKQVNALHQSALKRDGPVMMKFKEWRGRAETIKLFGLEEAIKLFEADLDKGAPVDLLSASRYLVLKQQQEQQELKEQQATSLRALQELELSLHRKSPTAKRWRPGFGWLNNVKFPWSKTPEPTYAEFSSDLMYAEFPASFADSDGVEWEIKKVEEPKDIKKVEEPKDIGGAPFDTGVRRKAVQDPDPIYVDEDEDSDEGGAVLPVG